MMTPLLGRKFSVFHDHGDVRRSQVQVCTHDREMNSFQRMTTTMVMSDRPESSLPYPPIHPDKKFVVLTDWSVKTCP